MDGLIVGRVVHYVLSKQDVEQINHRRTKAYEIFGMENFKEGGFQYHVGNLVEDGQHCAMVITEVHSDQGLVNGKVLLDGSDDHWVTSRSFDNDTKKPLTWHWIEKA